MDVDRQKVLIVDDEDHILRSTQMLLNVLGYDAVTLKDPLQIVQVAEREQPDLILQDLRMPHIDVPGIVRDLRKNPATADIPFAFFSASPGLGQTAQDNDVENFLQKPFREPELLRLLGRTMPEKHRRRGAS